jgi:phage-related protein
MSQLGKAYIEVTADLSKFPAELRAKLKAALAQGLEGVGFEQLEAKAKVAGEKAGDAAGSGFNRKIKKKIESEAATGALGFLSSIAKVFDKAKDNKKGGFFGSVQRLFSDAAETGIKGAAEKAGTLVGVLGQAGSAISSIGGTVGSIVQVAAWVVLVPIIIQLAGALVQLGAALFALPAAAGVALGILAPLIIAFQGFGEAVSLGFSSKGKDVQKFNEELKKLPPSMRSVVKEVVGLKGSFSGFKDAIQEAFFRPLVGVVGPAIRSFLAVVLPGLVRIAGSLGHVGAELLRTFTSPENLRTFAALLDTTNRVAQALEPTLSNLAQAFFNLIRPALPFIERGATGLRDFAASVESFTRRIAGGGQLTGWLERAAHIFSTLVGIAKEFGTYVITALGGEIGDIGTGFLDDLLAKFKELVAFIKGPDGQQTIHNLGIVIKALGQVFIWLLGIVPLASKAVNFVFDAIRYLLKGLQWLGAGFVYVIQKIIQFIGWLGTGIGHGFAVAYRAVVSWLKSAGSAIASFFTEDIPRWFGQVIDWFRALPGKIVDAFSSFRAAGRQFIIDTLTAWYTSVLEGIGNIIGIILGFPQIVALAWEKLKQGAVDAWNAIVAFFQMVWDGITSGAEAAWNGVVAFFSFIWDEIKAGFWAGIHGIEDAWNAIPGLLSTAGDAIKNFFVDLWDNVVVASYDAVVSGFNKVIDFFSGLPQRIRDLGPKLYQAAVDLGHKIGDGLSNIGSFASDVGHKIVNVIRDGINYVIGHINSGIAEIDDKLPGTLPRIPLLARGAVVDSPTLALIGEAGPEVVVPLSNSKRAQQLAEQSGLLSMLRGVGGGTSVTVIAYLDPSGVIIPITKTVVNDTLNEQGDELAYARAAA